MPFSCQYDLSVHHKTDIIRYSSIVSCVLPSSCPQHCYRSSISTSLPSLVLPLACSVVISSHNTLSFATVKTKVFCLSVQPSLLLCSPASAVSIMTDRALTRCLTRCAALRSPTVLSILTDLSSIPPFLFLLPSG